MFIITGYGKERKLIRDDNIEIEIGDKQLLEYKGIHYKSDSYDETTFIGLVECPRIIDSETVGIYIKPMYLIIDNKWHKIINYVEPRTKNFSYPHLLVFSDENNSLRTISELPNTSLEICL